MKRTDSSVIEGVILQVGHLVHAFSHPERHQTNLLLEHIVNPLLITVGVVFKLVGWIVNTILVRVRLRMDVPGHPKRGNHLKGVCL